MTKEDKAFLIGCVIGDGHLTRPKKAGASSELRLRHSIKQKDFMLWKVDRLRSILKSKSTSKVALFNNSGYLGIRWSKGHKYFRILRKWMYKDSKKILTPFILNKLTPEAIAIWYMDDGSLTKKKKNGHIHAREGMLNTYLSLKDNQIIADYFFKKWGIKMSHHKNKGLYRLRFGGKELWKFVKLVTPYMHKSMKYKIDLDYKREVIKKQYQEFLLN